MALRVLLADESATIKKVFQLALQDYAVEVKPVNIGLDVLAVAKKFKPDIIFADILLQKKNGYEVSAEIKAEPELKNVPVVLMWSGFMELDEDKLQASHASAQLEKPFDVTALRKVINELVPKTQTQRLSKFLTFPKMPDFAGEENSQPGVKLASTQTIGSTPPPMPTSARPEDDSEDFQQVPLPKIKPKPAEVKSAADLGDSDRDHRMSSKNLSRFKIDLSENSDTDLPVEYLVPEDQIDVKNILQLPSGEDDEFQIREGSKSGKSLSGGGGHPHEGTVNIDSFTNLTKAAANIQELSQTGDESGGEVELEVEASPQDAGVRPSSNGPSTANLGAALNPQQLEDIIRAQSKEVIESVVWKVVPDLAAQIIERELKRLLAENESSLR